MAKARPGEPALRALVAVVEHGGYSNAARQLGLAQPTVYRAAREFEGIVGIDLFARTAARGIDPSDTARMLARYAELVFAEIRQGFEEVGELSGRSDGRIAVDSLPLARSEFLPTAVIRLAGERRKHRRDPRCESICPGSRAGSSRRRHDRQG